ncbi:MAG: substrate-binding domain-containing protein [Phycisphaeraceae bacterium]
MAQTRDILIVPPDERQFATDLMVGVGRYATSHGPWVFHTLGTQEWEFPRVEQLAAWRGDGILLPVMTQARLAEVLATGRPFVNLTAWPDIPSVVSDNAAVGRLGAEHLLSQGFRRFAFLGLPRGIYIGQRREAFVERIAAAGFPCICHDGSYRTASDWRWHAVQADLRQWLRSLERPVAVMASHDARARHVLEAARSLRVGVPDEVAVLGVGNDTILGELSSPTLSSIELNGERVGFEAAAMLDRMMQGQFVPRGPLRVPPGKVVMRRSTEALAIDDADVARAVRFIRERGNQALRVETLLDVVPVSRATLERKFRQSLGRSPFDEIRRVQVEHIQRLLTNTDWSIQRIAVASAFPDARRLAAAFHKATGLTPTEYRRHHCGG